MITKERLYQQIQGFPNELKIEDLIEQLLLIDKIDSRVIESDKDHTISEVELDKEVNSWSK